MPNSSESLQQEYILLCMLISNTLCSAWIVMLNKIGQIAQEMVRVTDSPSLPLPPPRPYQLRWLRIVSVRVVMLLITSCSLAEKSAGCRTIKSGFSLPSSLMTRTCCVSFSDQLTASQSHLAGPDGKSEVSRENSGVDFSKVSCREQIHLSHTHTHASLCASGVQPKFHPPFRSYCHLLRD